MLTYNVAYLFHTVDNHEVQFPQAPKPPNPQTPKLTNTQNHKRINDNIVEISFALPRKIPKTS